MFCNKIFSSKIDKFVFYIMLKTTFIKKEDNDKNNFELVFYDYICKISKFFMKNNQTYKLAISSIII